MVASQIGEYTLSRASMTAREIADDLEERIHRGEYPPGTQLLLAELAELYGCHRSTIQRVMDRLSERGLTEYRPGRGQFVREHEPD